MQCIEVSSIKQGLYLEDLLVRRVALRSNEPPQRLGTQKLENKVFLGALGGAVDVLNLQSSDRSRCDENIKASALMKLQLHEAVRR
jgi:hypothetical protein